MNKRETQQLERRRQIFLSFHDSALTTLKAMHELVGLAANGACQTRERPPSALHVSAPSCFAPFIYDRFQEQIDLIAHVFWQDAEGVRNRDHIWQQSVKAFRHDYPTSRVATAIKQGREEAFSVVGSALEHLIDEATEDDAPSDTLNQDRELPSELYAIKEGIAEAKFEVFSEAGDRVHRIFRLLEVHDSVEAVKARLRDIGDLGPQAHPLSPTTPPRVRAGPTVSGKLF
jgi:hypothetical protein